MGGSGMPTMDCADDVFHRGEQALQREAGTRERLLQAGPRIVASRVHASHREFFARLPFVVVGAADEGGQPWASLLFGEGPDGLVDSPDDTTLRLRALPPVADPLRTLLRPRSWVGLLGIELPTRRRNRANGRVVDIDERGLTVRVEQSFGNCPKYIQSRERVDAWEVSAPKSAREDVRLDAEAARRVRGADTLFIASRAAEGLAGGGADVSHRGGLPGFVRVADDGRSLAWSELPGNGYFNTLGNLLLEPRAGLVFPDFASGDLLHVAGRARIVGDAAVAGRVDGAQPAVVLDIERVVWRPAAMPLRWRLVERSPWLGGAAAG